MTHNAAFSEDISDINIDEGSSSASVSKDTAHLEKCITYHKLLNILSQELPDANSNLLKNPIHPIFQKRNWHEPAQDVWPQLQPALRLASRFIDGYEMLEFWYHLIWGRQEMQYVSNEFGHKLEWFSAEGQPLNTAQKHRITHWLRDFGENQESDFLSFKAGLKLGKTSRSKTQKITIELVWELLEVLRDYGSGTKARSETRLLILNFAIAMILLHELGHAVDLAVSYSSYEPYYGHHAVAEVGHAWGCWAFGGAITTIRNTTEDGLDPIAGFWVATPPSPWHGTLPEFWPASRPPPPVLGDLPKNVTSWVLGMEYIQLVQTEEFWEIDIIVDGMRALHVPPTDEISDNRNPYWVARVGMSRTPNDDVNIESYLFRDGAEFRWDS